MNAKKSRFARVFLRFRATAVVILDEKKKKFMDKMESHFGVFPIRISRERNYASDDNRATYAFDLYVRFPKIQFHIFNLACFKKPKKKL